MKRYWTILSLFLVIALWWWITLSAPSETSSAHSDSEKIAASSAIADLPRSALREALAGDVALIEELLKKWMADAKRLTKEGTKKVVFLSEEELKRAEDLSYQLLHYSGDQLAQLREAHRLKLIIDETGVALNLEQPPERFLPQTYSSASILMAISEPESIVALPKGMRDHSSLFDPSLLDAVPLDADRYHSESIYNRKPEVAFVAKYSLPSTLETLRRQGLKLFSYSKTDAVDEVIDGMVKMGNVVNRPLKAELMALFMRGALMNLDNHVRASDEKLPKRPLYLNAYAHYSCPTQRTLPSELLARVKRNELIRLHDPQKSSAWRLPITFEKIAMLNPDCIIVSTSKENRYSVVSRLLSEPSLAETTAVKQKHVVAVDEAVQTSPSQYLVLAYYDIIEALMP